MSIKFFKKHGNTNIFRSMNNAGTKKTARGGLSESDIDLFMSHIQVATDNHRFLGIKTLEIMTESILPLHTVLQPFESILRVGSIAGHQIEIVHL